MGFKNSFILLILFFCNGRAFAAIPPTNSPGIEAFIFESADTVFVVAGDHTVIDEGSRPSPLLQLLRARQKKNKKVVAALLAFPFPFGIVGLHRIYLGCAPYVPVAYIGTLGGVFGVLPFIDFCVLLLDKDIDRYINNKKIFMWVN